MRITDIHINYLLSIFKEHGNRPGRILLDD
jgi:hypothetical protein